VVPHSRRGSPPDPRHPDQQVLTQAEELVVGAGRREAHERSSGPLRELLIHQTAHRRIGDRDLVLVQRPGVSHRP